MILRNLPIHENGSDHSKERAGLCKKLFFPHMIIYRIFGYYAFIDRYYDAIQLICMRKCFICANIMSKLLPTDPKFELTQATLFAYVSPA